MNRAGVISLLVGRMLTTLRSPERVEFATQEALYSDVHRQIHVAIQAMMPDHAVGKVRDSAEVGNHRVDYVRAYNQVYTDSHLRELLKSSQQDQQKMLIFSATADYVERFQRQGIHGAVISNALHDALHDVLTDVLCKDLCGFFKHLRFLFRQLAYHHLAQPNKPFEMRPEDTDVEQPRDDFNESLHFVLEQLQMDIGISSKVFFS